MDVHGRFRDISPYYGGYLSRGEVVEITTGQRMKSPEGVKVIDLGDLNVYPVDWDQTAAALRDSMHQIARTGALPVILGGDHFITYPLVQGFKDAVAERGDKKIAARLRITWRVLDTGEVRRRQLLLPGAATDGPIASYASLC